MNAAAGRTIKSHQIAGWDDYPLVQWCRETLGLPAAISNDADAAGLAEARFGAGRGERVVFYITVGSGIGGALVIDGNIYGGNSGIAAELGHLRPGLQADQPAMTVEAAASGWGIAAAARTALAAGTDPSATDLLALAGGQADRLTCKVVAQAAGEGNLLARKVFRRAVETLGWAIAQMITLLAPGVVVLGGGVPQAGESLFFAPLRRGRALRLPPAPRALSHCARRAGRRGGRPWRAGRGGLLQFQHVGHAVKARRLAGQKLGRGQRPRA